jgi:RecG-like helicase
LSDSIKEIHFPKSKDTLLKARERLQLDEMLKIAIQIEKDKKEKEKYKSIPIIEDKELTKDFLSSLPLN